MSSKVKSFSLYLVVSLLLCILAFMSFNLLQQDRLIVSAASIGDELSVEEKEKLKDGTIDKSGILNMTLGYYEEYVDNDNDKYNNLWVLTPTIGYTSFIYLDRMLENNNALVASSIRSALDWASRSIAVIEIVEGQGYFPESVILSDIDAYITGTISGLTKNYVSTEYRKYSTAELQEGSTAYLPSKSFIIDGECELQFFDFTLTNAEPITHTDDSSSYVIYDNCSMIHNAIPTTYNTTSRVYEVGQAQEYNITYTASDNVRFFGNTVYTCGNIYEEDFEVYDINRVTITNNNSLIIGSSGSVDFRNVSFINNSDFTLDGSGETLSDATFYNLHFTNKKKAYFYRNLNLNADVWARWRDIGFTNASTSSDASYLSFYGALSFTDHTTSSTSNIEIYNNNYSTTCNAQLYFDVTPITPVHIEFNQILDHNDTIFTTAQGVDGSKFEADDYIYFQSSTYMYEDEEGVKQYAHDIKAVNSGNYTYYKYWVNKRIVRLIAEQIYESLGRPEDVYVLYRNQGEVLGDLSEYLPPEDMISEDYVFRYWVVKGQNTDTAIDWTTFAVEDDLILKPKITPNEYEIKYNLVLDGVTIDTSYTQFFYTTIDDLYENTNEQFRLAHYNLINNVPENKFFKGWSLYSNVESEMLYITLTRSNYKTLEFWAVFGDVYTVTYDVHPVDDADITNFTPITYNVREGETHTYRAHTVANVADVKEFLGWYDSADSNKSLVSFPITVNRNINLYPKWRYNLDVHFAKGESPTGGTVTFNEVTVKVWDGETLTEDQFPDPILDKPITASYAFVYWYDSTDPDQKEVTTSTVITKETTLWPKWIRLWGITFKIKDEDKSDVTFPGYNEYKVVTEWVAEGTLLSLYDLPDENPEWMLGVKVFKGWFLSTDETVMFNHMTGQPVTSDLLFYAEWKITYNLIFVGNSQEEHRVAVGNYFYLRNLRNTPVKLYHEFVGWYDRDDPDKTIIGESYGPVTREVHFYPMFSKIQIEVAYDVDGVQITDTVDMNTAIIQPEDPEKRFYTFVNWYTTSTFDTGTEYDFTTLVQERTVLYAKFVVTEYEVNYILTLPDGSTAPTIRTGVKTILTAENIGVDTVFIHWVKEDDIVGIPDRYYFNWWEDSDGNHVFNVEITEDNLENFTLYANWHEVSIALYFNITNGDNAIALSNEYGTITYLDQFDVNSHGRVITYMQYTSEAFVLPDKYLLFAEDNNYYIDYFYVTSSEDGNESGLIQILDNKASITFNDMVEWDDENRMVYIYPKFTEFANKPTVTIVANELGYGLSFSAKITNVTAESTLFAFKEVDGSYVKISHRVLSANTSSQAISLDKGAIFEQTTRIIFFLVNGNKSTVTSYSGLNSYYKIKYEDESYTIKWVVNKLSVPVLSSPLTYTYDGTKKTFDKYDISWSGFESSLMNLVVTPQTDAGEYTFSVELIDTVHYDWEDGSVTTYPWIIKPMEIQPKTFTGQHIVSKQYQGYVVRLYITDVIPSSITLDATEYEITGDYSSDQIGVHTFSVALIKNYRWQVMASIDPDGATLSDPINKTFTWELTKWQIKLFNNSSIPEYSLDYITSSNIHLNESDPYYVLVHLYTFDYAMNIRNWVSVSGSYGYGMSEWEWQEHLGVNEITLTLKNPDKCVWQDGTNESKVYRYKVVRTSVSPSRYGIYQYDYSDINNPYTELEYIKPCFNEALRGTYVWTLGTETLEPYVVSFEDWGWNKNLCVDKGYGAGQLYVTRNGYYHEEGSIVSIQNSPGVYDIYWLLDYPDREKWNFEDENNILSNRFDRYYAKFQIIIEGQRVEEPITVTTTMEDGMIVANFVGIPEEELGEMGEFSVKYYTASQPEPVYEISEIELEDGDNEIFYIITFYSSYVDVAFEDYTGSFTINPNTINNPSEDNNNNNQNNNNTTPEPEGNNDGDNMGIIIGAAVGVVAVIGIIIGIVVAKKKKKK